MSSCSHYFIMTLFILFSEFNSTAILDWHPSQVFRKLLALKDSIIEQSSKNVLLELHFGHENLYLVYPNFSSLWLFALAVSTQPSFFKFLSTCHANFFLSVFFDLAIAAVEVVVKVVAFRVIKSMHYFFFFFHNLHRATN